MVQIKLLQSKVNISECNLQEVQNQSPEKWLKEYNPLINEANLQILLSLIHPDELSKCRNSIVMSFSSKNERMDYFAKLGLTHNDNFIYNPASYSMVKQLLEIESFYVSDLEILIIHFDNNDCKSAYGVNNYLVSTTFVAFIPNMNGIDKEKMIAGNKKIDPNLSNDDIAKSLTELDIEQQNNKKKRIGKHSVKNGKSTNFQRFLRRDDPSKEKN